ncbi:hypothetical protein GUJ93_ZPchr0004g39681 [Zizania palustris]|uniref:Uncharacterized protein n=1 Tax=Zizania palustris TaxID=103762 RepID=A0A8J5T053_ZIZPA|nr:hypothetical protein GUJ93_ZPchr0004g39681 [Zizania palustris]
MGLSPLPPAAAVVAGEFRRDRFPRATVSQTSSPSSHGGAVLHHHVASTPPGPPHAASRLCPLPPLVDDRRHATPPLMPQNEIGDLFQGLGGMAAECDSGNCDAWEARDPSGSSPLTNSTADIHRIYSIYVESDFQVTDVKMICVDRLDFDLHVQSGEDTFSVRIPFRGRSLMRSEIVLNMMSHHAWEVDKSYAVLEFEMVQFLKII